MALSSPKDLTLRVAWVPLPLLSAMDRIGSLSVATAWLPASSLYRVSVSEASRCSKRGGSGGLLHKFADIRPAPFLGQIYTQLPDRLLVECG